MTEAKEVRWRDGAAIPCPLRGTTLVDEAGTLVFCPHLLVVASDGDGPCTREDGSAAELAESVRGADGESAVDRRASAGGGEPAQLDLDRRPRVAPLVPVGDRLAAWEHASLPVHQVGAKRREQPQLPPARTGPQLLVTPPHPAMPWRR